MKKRTRPKRDPSSLSAPPEDFSSLPVDDMIQFAAEAGHAEARSALGQRPLSLEGVATLLRAPAEALHHDDLFARARSVTLSTFGRSVHLFAPCFISSFCENRCRYCTLNLATPVSRRWLSPPRALDEIRVLAGHGLRRIVLVAAEAPLLATPDYIARTVLAGRPLVPEIDLNVGAAGEDEYRGWCAFGAGGIICFQETYSRDAYDEAHPAGPKRDYDFRLGALERAGRAGMKRMGLGIFLGLADPVRDLILLVAHARHLSRSFPSAQISLSLPRIARTYGASGGSRTVDDEELLRFVAVLRLALPSATIDVSTREPEWLRERLLHVGANAMSVDAAIHPEAWVECQHDGGESELRDVRGVSELKWDLEDLGCKVRWTAPVGRPRRMAKTLAPVLLPD